MAVQQVPVNISEEYYQINMAILESFPRYRPPLDLFVFQEDIGQLLTYAKKGSRLSNEQVEEVRQLCEQGNLFVSRADHPVYSRHIIKQLDLVLLDKHLKEAEIADICLMALEERLKEFFNQPVKPAFDPLFTDLAVLTEYLWLDEHRIKLFMRRLHRGEHSLVHHSLNTLIVGLWLFALPRDPGLSRKEFDQAALGLLLHDAGMVKVPAFITEKTGPLKQEEREKIPGHVLAGAKIMFKLEETAERVREAVMEHHERLDGSGYPQHLKKISRFGQLTAVADAFSAMIQKRPYAEAKEPAAAAKELADERTRFDLAYSGKLLSGIITGSFGKFI
jgi:response regulator RpfG family c-di-GMP phosphodiesterase